MRNQGKGFSFIKTFQLATIVLVGITSILSYLAWKNRKYYELGVHYPYREKLYNEHWRLLSSGFLHANTTHLLVNMYMLYMFGQHIEHYFMVEKGALGQVLFVVLYLVTIVLSNFATGALQRNNPHYRSVGASGATSGILFIYILLDPWEMFLFPPLPAIVLAIGFLIYSSWASKKSDDNIDHMAHYYGAIIGVLFAFALFPKTLHIFLSKLINDFPL